MHYLAGGRRRRSNQRPSLNLHSMILKEKKVKLFEIVPLQFSLGEPDSETSPPANTKRSGSSSGATYDNLVSKKLMDIGFAQKMFKNNKPN